jgi:hypothetical protein
MKTLLKCNQNHGTCQFQLFKFNSYDIRSLNSYFLTEWISEYIWGNLEPSNEYPNIFGILLESEYFWIWIYSLSIIWISECIQIFVMLCVLYHIVRCYILQCSRSFSFGCNYETLGKRWKCLIMLNYYVSIVIKLIQSHLHMTYCFQVTRVDFCYNVMHWQFWTWSKNPMKVLPCWEICPPVRCNGC